MSPVILTPPPVPPLADPNSTAPPTLTITYYQQLAAHFLAVLDEITATLPKLESTPSVPARAFRTYLNVPLVFLGSAVASAEQLPELQALNKFDPLQARDTLQLIEAFRPLRDRVAAFELDLVNVLNTRQVALAVGALDTYDLVKSFARDKTNGPVAAANATLKRDLGRSGPRPKKVVVTPTPVPVPVPIPVPAPAPAGPSPVSTTAAPAKPEGWQG